LASIPMRGSSVQSRLWMKKHLSGKTEEGPSPQYERKKLYDKKVRGLIPVRRSSAAFSRKTYTTIMERKPMKEMLKEEKERGSTLNVSSRKEQYWRPFWGTKEGTGKSYGAR